MKRNLWAVLGAVAAAGLLACGGEVIAVLGAIGAAGGDFAVDSNGATPQLDPLLQVPGDANSAYRINIGPTTFTDDNLFAASYGVEVIAGALPGVNCLAVTGTIAGDRLDLGACFRGRYTNVNRVLSDDGTLVLLFNQFNPSLAKGIWVDIRKPGRRVKFIDDVSGCELKDGVPTGARVSLVQVDDDLLNGVYNSVQQFRVGSDLWATGEYVGASGLRLSGTPGKLELERQRDNPATVCPP